MRSNRDALLAQCGLDANPGVTGAIDPGIQHTDTNRTAAVNPEGRPVECSRLRHRQSLSVRCPLSVMAETGGASCSSQIRPRAREFAAIRRPTEHWVSIRLAPAVPILEKLMGE